MSTGHVRELPSGRWRWMVGHGGRRRSGSCDTRGEAKLAMSQAFIEMGGDPAGARATVVELLNAWQAERSEEWSPTYTADIANVCGRLPADFLDRDIRAVTPPVIVGLHRALRKAGWSAHRIGRAHGAVSAAFKMAVGYGWARENPCRDLSAPAFQKAQIHVPEHDVVRTLLAAAPERIRLFLRLAAVTGARRGELVALQWRDLTGDTLTIRRTVVYTPRTGVVVRETTKTGQSGERRLELDDATVAALIAHRGAQTGLAVEQLLPSPVFIFSHDAGVTPWRPDYIGLAFRRLRDTVPAASGVRLHDLRHYVITTMLTDGETLIDAAAQAGHSTPTTTARVYAHYLPGRGKDSATKRAGRLSP